MPKSPAERQAGRRARLKAEGMVEISIQIPAASLEALRRIAAREGLSAGALAGRAILAFLEAEQAKQPLFVEVERFSDMESAIASLTQPQEPPKPKNPRSPRKKKADAPADSKKQSSLPEV